MRHFLPRCFALWAAWVVVGSWAWAEEVDYLREVKPIFEKRCYACHGILKQNGSLRLDTAASMLTGGDSGAALVAGSPDDSLIVQVMTGDAGYRMPPEDEGAPATPDEIAAIRRWISAGALAPPDELPQQDPRQHWSYQPVRRPAVPDVRRGDWIRNPIDAFIAAQHERQQLVPRPRADKATLLRRVYLDLIGVPPRPEDLHAFLNDSSPQAYERVVDRLLESPLYGQRWGRHWMDVWRYSDWYGSRAIDQIRYGQRHSWRWRDWIVESLNADKGYDQMVSEMLAGDERAPGDPDVVRATGMLGRNWYKFDRDVWMFDTVEHTAQALLGLTMRCARCHDHKFDPVTQREYYRFRAYFEPHDVRIDPIDGTQAVEKAGLSLVYDKQLDAPTYLLERGDSRSPRKDDPLEPGVPDVFGLPATDIEPVAIPAPAAFPYLRPQVLAGLREKVRQAESAAQSELARRQTALQDARARVEQSRAGEIDAPIPAGTSHLFVDDFSSAQSDVWTAVNGNWHFADGHVIQDQPGNFCTLASRIGHPEAFALRLRYTPTPTGTLHSVGLFFDSKELRDAQAVYTAITDTNSSVQAFHREGGAEQYPSAGIRPHPLKLGEPITLDIAARGQLLNVWVNGQLAIVYTMPKPRQAGTLALWTHAGSARFDELICDALPETFNLATQLSETRSSPFEAPAMAQLQLDVARAERLVEVQQQVAAAAEQELRTLEARIAADQSKADGAAAELVAQQAQLAARAERHLAHLKAQATLLEAEQLLAAAQQSTYADQAARDKAVADVQKKVDAAREALTNAAAAETQEDANYTPLGPSYPRTSSGRRSALARWITDPGNPRTARVAVNHIWLRHFGEALVPSTANFGIQGQPPSHPELLDWLAAELMQHDWRMKHMHRLMVTSSTYRMTSAEAQLGSAGDEELARNIERDPENRFLWRMNSRRAEAEVVRDSLLWVAGKLDVTPGGPELPESEGQMIARRTLYFRNTPNEKMLFSELFDVANPNACYRRQTSVLPQQALAMTNSQLALTTARQLATELAEQVSTEPEGHRDTAWLRAAFERVLSRPATDEEQAACERFLRRHVQLLKSDGQQAFPAANPNVVPPSTDPLQHARENLVHVLLNHNDFVTIR